jgi:hypothetical protein
MHKAELWQGSTRRFLLSVAARPDSAEALTHLPMALASADLFAMPVWIDDPATPLLAGFC